MKKILLTFLLIGFLFPAYFEYWFYRPCVNNSYLDDSLARTNEDGTVKLLSVEVEGATFLGGEIFLIKCEDTNMIFYFKDELNGPEENSLEDTVADHTNNI